MQTAVPVVGLFLFAWLIRSLFLSASPDGIGPFSPFYKGDAPLWLAYAASLQQGQPFELELGLPLRPPGNAWLVDFLWDGSVEGLPGLRSAFAFIGALAVPMTYAVAQPLGRHVALVGSGWVAISFASLQLSASPNVEAPYQLLALGSIWAAQRMRRAERGASAVASGLAFGAFAAAGCLFRAEHALLCVGLLAWVAIAVGRRRCAPVAKISLLVSIVVGVLLSVPWHLEAWGRVATFNRTEWPLRAARTLPWSEEAVVEVDRLPGFARADAQRLIEDTARHRRVGSVSLQEVRVLDEAFGWRPEPLPERFFVALYGPLNFYLGQTGGPGFRRDALQALPPLEGGRDRYPPGWLASLPPPGGLSLGYPPHLRPIVHGYSDGLGVLAADLPRALSMTVQKVWRALRGATSGIGGADWPACGPFVRSRVDQTVSSGGFANLWSVAVLALAGFGLWRGRRRMAELAPLLWWSAAGLGVVAMFFGYARLGALLTPVVGVLLGLGSEPLSARWPRGALRVGLGFLLAVLVLENLRSWHGVRFTVDGADVQTIEPWPPLEFEDRRIEVRPRDQDG